MARWFRCRRSGNFKDWIYWKRLVATSEEDFSVEKSISCLLFVRSFDSSNSTRVYCEFRRGVSLNSNVDCVFEKNVRAKEMISRG